MSKILFVHNDNKYMQRISDILHNLGCDVTLEKNIEHAENIIKDNNSISIVLIGLNSSKDMSIYVLNKFLSISAHLKIIIVTKQGDPDTASEAIENGAWDYIEKPITIPKIRLAVQRALLHSKEQDKSASLNCLHKQGLIGSNPAFLNCLQSLAKLAAIRSNVLLLGETGTGKELFAKVMHKCSPWAHKPFVTVDCASLPENLIESLLHGHTKGSFTGANASKTGLIKQADGGTLFLDEIGELPLDLQKAFLRILQERKVLPIGSSREEKSDFRLIAASNRNINEMVNRGEFRQDLYYRLNTNLINIPALRCRKEDIIPLSQKIMTRVCKEYDVQEKSCTKDFIYSLQEYDWPGNVRELISVLYASVNAAIWSPEVFPQHLWL